MKTLLSVWSGPAPQAGVGPGEAGLAFVWSTVRTTIFRASHGRPCHRKTRLCYISQGVACRGLASKGSAIRPAHDTGYYFTGLRQPGLGLSSSGFAQRHPHGTGKSFRYISVRQVTAIQAEPRPGEAPRDSAQRPGHGTSHLFPRHRRPLQAQPGRTKSLHHVRATELPAYFPSLPMPLLGLTKLCKPGRGPAMIGVVRLTITSSGTVAGSISTNERTKS